MITVRKTSIGLTSCLFILAFAACGMTCSTGRSPPDRFKPSDLDHVVASNQLKFKPSFNGSDVDVRGWPTEQTEEEQKAWIDKYSDHALLFFQVEKV